MASFLASVPTAEATQAPIKIILFSPDRGAREAAIDALKLRGDRRLPEKLQPAEAKYTDELLQGLRYPWPEVSQRAADALVKLKLDRNDVLSRLVEALKEADPRAPVVREVEGKKIWTVREVVRVNHHRNCLMCHGRNCNGSISSSAPARCGNTTN